jgi:hypothetical protein
VVIDSKKLEGFLELVLRDFEAGRATCEECVGALSLLVSAVHQRDNDAVQMWLEATGTLVTH